MKLTCILVLTAGMCASGWASQQAAPAAQITTPAAVNSTPETTPQADPKAAIKARVTAYYTALIGGDKKTAEQFLVPESRADFEQGDFRTLADFSVGQIAIDPTGSKADVTVTRSFGGPFAMTLPFHEQWVMADGQWFLKLPENTHQTPFGTIMPRNTTNTGNATSTAKDDQEMMRRMTERQVRTIDPDQYLKQVDKYVREHPNSLPPMEVQVPVPQQQQQASSSKPASDAKAASANTASPAPANSKKGKKDKKKTSKKSDRPPADATPKS